MPIQYSRLQNFVFWGSEPLNVIGHHRDPQKAPPWPEPRLRANFGTDRFTGATCARYEKIKKGKERNFCWRRFPIDFGQWLIHCEP